MKCRRSQINKTEGRVWSIFTDVAFLIGGHVHWKQVQTNQNSQETRSFFLFLFFFTETLIYDEMGDMSASISKRHAYRSQSHTLDYRKANHNLPKKESLCCVSCF